MPWPLSLAKENVPKHSNDSNDVETLVMYSVVMEVVAVEYVEVEDTLMPLSLTKDSVMMCSCGNDNTKKEEVLAELTEQLRVFPPTSGLRGGLAEGRGEAHREGAGGREQLGVQGGLADVGCFGRCRGSASFDPRLPGVLDATNRHSCYFEFPASYDYAHVYGRLAAILLRVQEVSLSRLVLGVLVTNETPDRKDIWWLERLDNELLG
jgi:hypothetical protein